MTPKEKAQELVNKFYNTIYLDMNYNQAKYAALIAVDEILNIKSVDKDYDLSNYWGEVLTELEKL